MGLKKKVSKEVHENEFELEIFSYSTETSKRRCIDNIQVSYSSKKGQDFKKFSHMFETEI